MASALTYLATLFKPKIKEPTIVPIPPINPFVDSDDEQPQFVKNESIEFSNPDSHRQDISQYEKTSKMFRKNSNNSINDVLSLQNISSFGGRTSSYEIVRKPSAPEWIPLNKKKIREELRKKSESYDSEYQKSLSTNTSKSSVKFDSSVKDTSSSEKKQEHSANETPFFGISRSRAAATKYDDVPEPAQESAPKLGLFANINSKINLPLDEKKSDALPENPFNKGSSSKPSGLFTGLADVPKVTAEIVNKPSESKITGLFAVSGPSQMEEKPQSSGIFDKNLNKSGSIGNLANIISIEEPKKYTDPNATMLTDRSLFQNYFYNLWNLVSACIENEVNCGEIILSKSTQNIRNEIIQHIDDMIISSKLVTVYECGEKINTILENILNINKDEKLYQFFLFETANVILKAVVKASRRKNKDRVIVLCAGLAYLLSVNHKGFIELLLALLTKAVPILAGNETPTNPQRNKTELQHKNLLGYQDLKESYQDFIERTSAYCSFFYVLVCTNLNRLKYKFPKRERFEVSHLTELVKNSPFVEESTMKNGKSFIKIRQVKVSDALNYLNDKVNKYDWLFWASVKYFVTLKERAHCWIPVLEGIQDGQEHLYFEKSEQIIKISQIIAKHVLIPVKQYVKSIKDPEALVDLDSRLNNLSKLDERAKEEVGNWVASHAADQADQVDQPNSDQVEEIDGNTEPEEFEKPADRPKPPRKDYSRGKPQGFKHREERKVRGDIEDRVDRTPPKLGHHRSSDQDLDEAQTRKPSLRRKNEGQDEDRGGKIHQKWTKIEQGDENQQQGGRRNFGDRRPNYNNRRFNDKREGYHNQRHQQRDRNDGGDDGGNQQKDRKPTPNFKKVGNKIVRTAPREE